MTKELTLTSTQSEITPLNRIRVETALSRFPIHRLAKKGNVSIDIQNDQANFKWEVTYNAKHGQPGPLAYKLDTLIINRRIDELGRPLPEVIRIGSLSDICRGLGSSDTGPNITDLKRAFLQNAFAAITAKIRYKTKTGKERWAEIGYTRYSVIFTGEPLPDGSDADAVYIVLNPPYRDLLNHVEVRPLDYDYLRQLAPGPQRFYELLSFQVYGALASGRQRAKMLYSEYCKCAPQTRYLDFDHLKKQMYKVHLPHRESGYIIKVEYQQTTDREGNPDWEMLYTPGPKAKAEFNAFSRRVAAAQLPSGSAPVRRPQQQELLLEQSAEDDPVVKELARRGVTERKARALLANMAPGQQVMDQIEYTDFLISQAPQGKFHNPPGLFIRNIEQNINPPASFETSRLKRLRKEAQEAQYAERAGRARIELAYAEYQHSAVERYVREVLPAEEYQSLLAEKQREMRKQFKSMTTEQVAEIARTAVSRELCESGRVPLQTLAEFSKQYSTPSQ